MDKVSELVSRCLAEHGVVVRDDLPHNCLYRLFHHEVLIEFVRNPYKCIEYILNFKPEEQIATRLREFQPIEFAIGDPKAGAECDKAITDADRARVVAMKAAGMLPTPPVQAIARGRLPRPSQPCVARPARGASGGK